MHENIPEYFCWSRIGDEAGEAITRIVARKEQARQADGGVFLWGIGQSVGNSIRSLLEVTDTPEVLFTNMAGEAREQDRSPAATVLWRDAVSELDGAAYVLPRRSLVTSRASERDHWALVCQTDEPIDRTLGTSGFYASELSNIASGKKPADQQITTAVRYRHNVAARGKTRYRVRIRANLAAPYLVRLQRPVEVPPELRRRLASGDPTALDELEALAST